MIESTYYTRSYKIAANSQVNVDITGAAIKHLRGNGDLLLSIDDKAPTDFGRGIGYPYKDTGNFTKITLINNNAFEATGTVFYGTGDIENSSMTLADAVEVINKPATKIDVDDADTQVKLDSVITAVNALAPLMQNDTDKRADLTTLEGATGVQVSNATTTVVSAGANVNGVIIRTLDITVRANGTNYVKIGADYLYRENGTTSASVSKFIKDIHVPAGKAIVFKAGSTDYMSAFYEVL